MPIVKYLKREAFRGILEMFGLCSPKKSNKTNVLFLWEINFNSKLFSFNSKSQRDQAWKNEIGLVSNDYLSLLPKMSSISLY